MTNEEIQKMLEFIIERQEQFATNTEKADKRMNRLENAFVNMFNLVAENTKAQKELTNNVEALRGEVKELKDAQAETDERLNIFINVVERYITRNNSDSEGSKQS